MSDYAYVISGYCYSVLSGEDTQRWWCGYADDYTTVLQHISRLNGPFEALDERYQFQPLEAAVWRTTMDPQLPELPDNIPWSRPHYNYHRVGTDGHLAP